MNGWLIFLAVVAILAILQGIALIIHGPCVSDQEAEENKIIIDRFKVNRENYENELTEMIRKVKVVSETMHSCRDVNYYVSSKDVLNSIRIERLLSDISEREYSFRSITNESFDSQIEEIIRRR